LEYKEVTNVLGSSELLNNLNILNVLEALNFKIIRKTENYCEVHVPFSRENDIEREVDLIEEIVRICGFTSFLSIVPSLEKVGKFSKLEKLKRLLRKSFVDLGFQEALHYSISIKQSQQQVQLKNPIVPDSSSFRSNLLTQMIQKAAINKKQKNNIFEAFEIGRVYSVKNGNIIESELISGIFGGNLFSSNWNEDGKTINWFEGKGLINNIFNLLNIEVAWSKQLPKENNLFHPGRCAVLFSKDQKIGFFGQIHPTQAKIKSLNYETFLFEFNIEVLKFLWEEQTIYTYKPYSLFPVSLVDLAFIKPNNILFKDIETKIREVGGPLLETIHLFDYYSGAPIQQGYHNLGFKLKFRNLDRTLTNEEVDNILKKITNSLEKEFHILTRQ
jgi:phenylalanyl-tRNA synthetase beta chain